MIDLNRLAGNVDSKDNSILFSDAMELKLLLLLKVIVTVLILYLFYIYVNKSIKFVTYKRKIEKREYEEQKRLQWINRINSLLFWISNIVDSTVFGINKYYEMDLEYNLRRAGYRVPGGFRNLNAKEFHAIRVLAIFLELIVIFVLFLIIRNMLVVLIGLSLVILTYYLPVVFLRATVFNKDAELKREFFDLFIVIYYSLIRSGNETLDELLFSYKKVCKKGGELERFIDVALYYIDVYGEYNATKYIIDFYKEVPEVSRLMRIIKQYLEKGEVKEELNGFKEESLLKKRQEMNDRKERLVKLARVSFIILWILLGQAILSAMSIYLSDLIMIKSLF